MWLSSPGFQTRSVFKASVLERRVGKPVRPSRVEKLLLALTAVHLKERMRDGRKWLNDCILLFQPATVLKWHRELVKRKWTFQQQAKVGRPRIEAALETLIVRLANENPGLGFEKLQGELLKLGYDVAISTFRPHRNATVPAAIGARS
jgi:cytochrome P450